MSTFWVQTDACRIGIMPRPRGGDWLEDDIRMLKGQGVDVIVSALEAEECSELELLDEAELCCRAGVEFLCFPIPDRSLPASVKTFKAFIDSVDGHLRGGRAVIVHCRAGIGRSSLIAASLLLRHGFSVAEAFDLLQRARGCPVPDTQEQREWVERFAARAAGELE